MNPFKAYYSQEVETWLSNNPYRSLTCYQIGELMGKAYAKCSTLQIAASGFKKCGILPFNRNLFQESDFIDLNEPEPKSITNVSLPTDTLSQSPDPRPFTSTCHIPEQSIPSSSKTLVSPFSLKPLPKLPAKSSKPKRWRPAGKAAIVTSYPYKINLENEIKKSLDKEIAVKIKKENVQGKKLKVSKKLTFKQSKNEKGMILQMKMMTFPSYQQTTRTAQMRSVFTVFNHTSKINTANKGSYV